MISLLFEFNLKEKIESMEMEVHQTIRKTGITGIFQRTARSNLTRREFLPKRLYMQLSKHLIGI